MVILGAPARLKSLNWPPNPDAREALVAMVIAGREEEN
jgi:hypothetical protein